MRALSRLPSSVTRFGGISPLRHNFKKFGLFLSNYLVFGKIVNLLWQILHIYGQFSLFKMAKY